MNTLFADVPSIKEPVIMDEEEGLFTVAIMVIVAVVVIFTIVISVIIAKRISKKNGK